MAATSVSVGARSRWERLKGGLTPAQWRTVAGMFAVIAALHVAGFVLLLVVVAPRNLAIGDSGVFTVGIGLTAYTLGLRHAFDADHIGAIDNTTRKLMSDGQRPVSVGFFFSLGHSTIVFLLAVAFTLGIRGLSGAVGDDGSWLHQATGLIGPTVSGAFLTVIGILNLLVLVGIVRIFRRMRGGDYSEAELEDQLNNRGLLTRFYRRATDTVTKPWHMYPVGLLFGLGFDTATEVALLATAGAAAAGGLPIYAVLCLPLLFAAGMSLLDAIDGAFMNFAYGWAFAKPVRKIFYNITITWLSVVIALVIGAMELLSVLADRLTLTGQPWDFVSGVDLNHVGYAIVALFVLTWVVALAVWHLGDIEAKWSGGVAPADPPS
jgi:nickel/cobalt transporter (NiCoT) family protein